MAPSFYEIGFRCGASGKRITVELLSHSPADPLLGDMLTKGFKSLIIEFKSDVSQIAEEPRKDQRKPFFERLRADPMLAALASKGHFVLCPMATDGQIARLSAMSYDTVSSETNVPSSAVADVVLATIVESAPTRLGFTEEEFERYTEILLHPSSSAPGSGTDEVRAVEANAILQESAVILHSHNRIGIVIGDVTYELLSRTVFDAARRAARRATQARWQKRVAAALEEPAQGNVAESGLDVNTPEDPSPSNKQSNVRPKR